MSALPGLWWQQLALVMSGGALGAAGRFLLGGYLLRHLGTGFPWGTLAANLLGSFIAGFLVIWLEDKGPSALYWRAFLIVGVLGALTTFSALMIESLLYAKSDRSGVLLGYLVVSLTGGLILVWLGSRLALWLNLGLGACR
ncbi:fluoride efflux transporter CrcB [Pseudoxanthomonas kalamensis DSM 18571]|uniref:fluoride efflux transporter CrcB n=1 Tax=Pseudoxanthomonas kalamensis TaxID=289483 RepID=UPI001391BDCE|nr:fluoride efflux transporter CrcB [Pseudoxanthomonas kalamensis]KAF1709755.1 fluoride efflux transporter CrcB [Pseudoxanthomonas kalamensis DSM 18571]